MIEENSNNFDRMRKYIITLITVLMAVVTSCSSTPEYDSILRKLVIKECVNFDYNGYILQGQLDSTISSKKVYMDGDYLVNVVVVPDENKAQVLWNTNEKNKERVMATLCCSSRNGRINFQRFADLNIGMRYIYQDSNGTELVRTEMSSEDLRIMIGQVENGTLEPYSFLEWMEINFSFYRLPRKENDELKMWLTNAYVRDSTLTKEYTIQIPISKENFTKEISDDLKQGLAYGLFTSYNNMRTMIIKDKPKFEIILKESRGNLLAKYQYRTDELFE